MSDLRIFARPILARAVHDDSRGARSLISQYESRSMVAVRKPERSPEIILQQVWDTRKLTRKDHVRLSSFLLSIVDLTPRQREQVHHIFDELSVGTIQLID